MSETIEHIACAACGFVCEDVVVRIDSDKVASVSNACPLCEVRLLGQSANPPATCSVDGKAVDQGAALDKAVEILASASSPLICGLVGSTIETQRAAVALADRLGATIDPCLTSFHRAAIQAFQSVGISTCTLGEVKQRADVIVVWGSDPAAYSQIVDRFVGIPGQFVQQRHTTFIGAEPPAIRADEFITIDQAKNFAAISLLRAMVFGIDVDSYETGGVPVSQIKPLAAKLSEANYSAIFLGPGIGGVAEIESLFLLVRQLNVKSRCAIIPLGGVQSDAVLTWQTGYPCGVNFAIEYPRYDPHAYSASTLIERGEVNAVLMVGSDGLETLSDKARTQLDDLPVILLDTPVSNQPLRTAVHMTMGDAGVHYGGRIFRMDGVPLALRSIFSSSLSAPAKLLTAIMERIE